MVHTRYPILPMTTPIAIATQCPSSIALSVSEVQPRRPRESITRTLFSERQRDVDGEQHHEHANHEQFAASVGCPISTSIASNACSTGISGTENLIRSPV